MVSLDFFSRTKVANRRVALWAGVAVMPLTFVGQVESANASTSTNVHALGLQSQGAAPMTSAKQGVLSDVWLLEKIGAQVLRSQEEVGVGYAELTESQVQTLSEEAHHQGKCAGFEAVTLPSSSPRHDFFLTGIFDSLTSQHLKEKFYRPQSNLLNSLVPNEKIETALRMVSADRLRETVQFMSAFHDRLHRGPQPNVAVEALKNRIMETIQGSTLNIQVELISHRATKQQSIRARIPGRTRPNEIIVMGSHLDSINQEFGGNKVAPGADDNASGSANILEALRVVAQQNEAPERTLDFFWYAGEEGGLLGSAEIAKDYKNNQQDVIAALQLDMTLFAGEGQFTLGSMTDFTSPWLRNYLESINTIYINAKIINDKCGYGCSDHASWHRQGYPALMPFESSFNKMNRALHTKNDIIDGRSNFEHSAMFSKIAVTMALDLGNSNIREPKLLVR